MVCVFKNFSELLPEVDLHHAKTRYKPGESLDLSGVRVALDGEDVTDRVEFFVEDDLTVFPSDAHDVVVIARVGNAGTSFLLKRSFGVFPFVLCAFALSGVAVAVALAM